MGGRVDRGNGRQVRFQATIDSKPTLLASLDLKIKQFVGETYADEADFKAATDIRAKEASDFAASGKRLTEVIDILNHAIGLLERHASLMKLKNANDDVQAT